MRFKIEEIIYTALIIAFICLMGGGLLRHFAEGLSLFAGAAWGAVNLFFLKNVLENLLLRRAKRTHLFLFICLKWPLLYLAGYALLKTPYLLPLYLLLGFSLIFIIIVIFGGVGVLMRNEK